MNTIFDDLTREIARGHSRRDALRRLGIGLVGLFLASLGVKKASAAVSCGTCQACNLDTNTCGLPCSPTSTGQTLCTMASSDGSYLRLVNYLTANGFVSAGVSDSVLLYRSGSLFQSVLATNFQNPSVPSEIAFVAYAVSPEGGITPLAVVLQNGIPSYGLNVDYNGRIVQTAATRTSSSSTTAETRTSRSGTNGVPSLTRDGRMARQAHSSASISGVYHAEAVSPETCDIIIDIVCGVVVLGAFVCYAVGAAACSAEAALTALIGGVPCAIAVAGLCGLASYGACEAAKAGICNCPLNEQNCNGVCCGPCMDCLNNTCIPNITCSQQGLGPCCGSNQCCAAGFTCSNNVCTSPNSGCVGATCSTFVPCSSSNPDCVCGSITEGGGLCVPGSTPCAGLDPCNSSADCGADALCLYGSCCGEPVCVPVALSGQCPASDTSSAIPITTAVTGSGPTIGHR